jgi:ATP-binding cassette subfamily C protein
LISYIVPKSIYRSGRNAGESYRVQFGIQSQYILDRLKGLKELYIFGQEKQTMNQIDRYSEDLNDSTLSLKKHEGLLKALTDGALYLSVFLQIGMTVYLYGQSKVDAGTGLLAMLLLFSSFGPALALSQLSASLVHTFASAKRVLGIINLTPEVMEEGNKELTVIHDIKYEHVQFGYEKNHPLYKNVNLEWRLGEIIGIKGDNGAGKSTLISLLLRDIPVTHGAILVNGISIQKYSAESYRKQFSMVDAHTIVFSDTLRKNLAVYKEYTDEEIWDACKKAGLDQFVKDLPDGLDTHLQEFGENLSSGQQQRLALARLFLDDAPVFILDEPTTNLDALNESYILQTIKAHAGGKLVILISHHAEVLAMADRIFEVSDGQITEMEYQSYKKDA